VTSPSTTSVEVVGDLATLIPAFRRSLRAANKSPKTIKVYTEAASQLVAFLRQQGMPTEAVRVGREHVESFIEHLVVTWKPATANNRYRALAQLFAFLVDFGEISGSPMATMTPPKVPEVSVPVLSEADLRRLLKACEGKEYEAKRDTAIIRTFIDTGMRCSELANLQVEDLDLDDAVAIVLGKGRRPRACPFGNRTAAAIDRYLRLRTIRARHCSHSSRSRAIAAPLGWRHRLRLMPSEVSLVRHIRAVTATSPMAAGSKAQSSRAGPIDAVEWRSLATHHHRDALSPAISRPQAMALASLRATST
jgi:site-specific recombinase XerD